MILSEERQAHLAQLLTDKVWGDDIVDFSDDDEALKAAKRGIVFYLREVAEIDTKAREKILTLKRGVIEGTSEWEIMYRKYYEEEKIRRG